MKPVPLMKRRDFGQEQSALTLTGMSWIGNASLWRMGRKNRMGVFAADTLNGSSDSNRSQWAIQMGVQRKCLMGTFRFHSESEILRLHLKHGGRAIWVLGREFPDKFNKECVRALWEKRLLVVSCFWKASWNFFTYRYCSQLVAMGSGNLAFWSIDENSYASAVYRKAMAYGIPATLYY